MNREYATIGLLYALTEYAKNLSLLKP
jgi:hypothetical protein